MTVIWLSLTPEIEFSCDFVNADKVYHMLAYLWLSALPFFVFSRPGGALTGALTMIFLGIALEFVQAHVPGRSFSVADMAANSLGVILGIWLGRYMRRKHLLFTIRARAK